MRLTTLGRVLRRPFRPFKEFYDNGQLKAKTNFKDGKEDGLRKETQSKNKQQQERERFVDAERSPGTRRAMAGSLQHDSSAQFARLSATSTRNTDANRGVRQSSNSCVN